jgi:formylmethanofuran dehydrogenase subunit B
MMQQHMQQMKAQVESMRAKVDQMKANVARIKDPATKQQMQLDTELWDAMVSHLEGMQKMMSEHGMGMGGMHHGPHGPQPPERPAPPQQ